MSALVVTTIFHLVMGLIIAALFLDDPRPGARVGLCLIAGAFGVIAIAVAFLIHGRRPLSPGCSSAWSRRRSGSPHLALRQRQIGPSHEATGRSSRGG